MVSLKKFIIDSLLKGKEQGGREEEYIHVACVSHKLQGRKKITAVLHVIRDPSEIGSSAAIFPGLS